MFSRLALVVADQQLAPHVQSTQSVEKYLHETLGHTPFRSSFESVRDHLNPKGGLVLLLLVGSPVDLGAAIRLIQEVRLMQWPCRILLLTCTLPLIAP